MTDLQILSIGVPIGITLAGALVSYGVLKARTNGYVDQIRRLEENKAEKDVVSAEFQRVEVQFKAMNEKLDLILENINKRKK